MVVKINIEKQVQHFLAYITEKRTNVDGIAEDLLQIAKRKKQLFQKRNAEIVKATADVSLRRLQQFRIRPNESIRWSFGTQSGIAEADAHGLLTLPRLEITASPTLLKLSGTGRNR